MRLSQRLHQAAGFTLERGEPCAEGAQLLSQRRGGQRAILLDVDHPGVDGLERLRDRADHLRDRLLALLEVPGRALVELLERRGRQGDHGFRVRLQRFGRRGPEDVAKLLLGAIEQRLPVVGRFEARLSRGGTCRYGGCRLGDFATFLLPDEEPGQKTAGRKRDQQFEQLHESDCTGLRDRMGRGNFGAAVPQCYGRTTPAAAGWTGWIRRSGVNRESGPNLT